ncbi:CYFA0S08e04676g1_1 [Cyberlindnera fabianii]|uniref:CYFA0S08e04676g1_1 n=1 Tax=Cyberlindnera fabianii TaxID=36022 RepID=A0A061AX03_CYBFA|nr:CYFA0S08e04676g1_1 [Cyberlindnera fabianii]
MTKPVKDTSSSIEVQSSIEGISSDAGFNKQQYADGAFDSTSIREKVITDAVLDEHNPKRAPRSRGVQRIENVKMSMDSSKKGRNLRLIFCLCLLLNSWVSTLQSITVYNYEPYATSAFQRHSQLATSDIATGIISAVCKPMIAKIADITSRTQTYILVLILYTLGYIIVAASSNINAYIAGNVFITIGQSGISLLDSIISADITPLKYRGLLIGILASPYIINTWFGGLIVEAILKRNWRWGYGMFAIIMPATVLPSVLIMIYLEHRSTEEQIALGNDEREEKRTWSQTRSFIWKGLVEVDIIGLMLLGFGWSLLLLPFSLRSTANNGWENPSLIAMFCVGGILLIVHLIYEFWLAKFPSMPKRILMNRTFITAVIIDFIYQFGGLIRSTYWSSYVRVVQDWAIKYWTYYNNTLTMSLCVFGVVVGVIIRYTRRSKYLQAFGLALQVVAKGLSLHGSRASGNNAVTLVWAQLIGGMGGACVVVGTQCASQASVTHQDVALAISLLSLWSTIGNSIGSAVAGAVWQSRLPGYLRQEMPDSVNDTMVKIYFGSIAKLAALPYDSPARQGAINAYYRIMWILSAASLGVAFVPFLAVFFQKNFYLGDNQNGVETPDGESVDLKGPKTEVPTTWWGKFSRFMDDPISHMHFTTDKAKQP